MHLNLIERGSKQPADLAIVRHARSQAKPAGSSPRHARRRVLPSRAERGRDHSLLVIGVAGVEHF